MASDDKGKNKGGRPPDTRPSILVKLPPEDFAVLQRVEARTSLAPEELVRMFVHIAIWETAGLVPDAFTEALDQGRKDTKAP
jgi:hypothetical protein